MAKATVASLAERLHVLEEQVKGLESALRAVPAARPREPYVPKTVQKPVVRVTCALKTCSNKTDLPREEAIRLAREAGGWKCPTHEH